LKMGPTPFNGRKSFGKILGTFINGQPSFIHNDLKVKAEK